MDSDALARSGIDALRRGDAAAARAAFEAVTAAGSAPPQPWVLLAQSCALLGDHAAADVALDAVLRLEPRNLYALLMKGDAFVRAGDDRAAVSWYMMALGAAAGATLTSDLPPWLAVAEQVIARAKGSFRGHLDSQLAARGMAEAGPRFAEALAILSGDKQVFFQAPTSFFYPGLPHIQFYDPAEFDWAERLEAATGAIRAELEAALASDTGLKPYVEADPTRPNKGHSLLGDPDWSAFHLIENGAPVPGNADRCPATLAALADLPIPQIAGRSPMALFSVLRPHTHIPPHSGMLNTRLIVHLPLIVLDGCRLRVGNDIRDMVEGKVMIFDDSIEHEAWNDSDETRVVLLFEIWRPELRAEERAALTAMFEAIGSYPSA
jgi:aspartyl/asparaginyl beta-hydroxylase (cupin superfamily)